MNRIYKFHKQGFLTLCNMFIDNPELFCYGKDSINIVKSYGISSKQIMLNNTLENKVINYNIEKMYDLERTYKLNEAGKNTFNILKELKKI